MKDKRFPDGKVEGRSIPDRGATTGVNDTYGASKADLNRGFSGGQSIGKHTGSDK